VDLVTNKEKIPKIFKNLLPKVLQFEKYVL